MRIRRRPQACSPSSPASDPSTSAATRNPLNAAGNQDRLEEVSSATSGAPPRAGSDLGRKPGVARRPSTLPLDNAVGCARILGARHGGDDLRPSVVSNGHGGTDLIKDEEACAGGEVVARNGVAEAPSNLAVKVEKNGSGGGAAAKRRRGTAVLMEGSRCSRVNGRGWRCSQPTLVGYSLCEHHLGKGRTRRLSCQQLGSEVPGGGGGGSWQLGRTEHAPRTPASPAGATAAAPTAGEPSPRRV